MADKDKLFEAHKTNCGFWQAWQRSSGAHCLHMHKNEATAQKCADSCNKPTRGTATPQGAWDHAAGYHN